MYSKVSFSFESFQQHLATYFVEIFCLCAQLNFDTKKLKFFAWVQRIFLFVMCVCVCMNLRCKLHIFQTEFKFTLIQCNVVAAFPCHSQLFYLSLLVCGWKLAVVASERCVCSATFYCCNIKNAAVNALCLMTCNERMENNLCLPQQ